VDNILSFGNDAAGLQFAQTQLHKIFDMEEEDPDWVMGFQLVENRKQGTLSIYHGQYINAILHCFNA